MARPKGIATKWYTLPKSKTMSKSEPKEPKERKEAIEEEKWSTGQLRKWSTDKLHPDSLENQEKI